MTDHLHDRGLAFDLTTLRDRRNVLKLLGGAGLVALVGMWSLATFHTIEDVIGLEVGAWIWFAAFVLTILGAINFWARRAVAARASRLDFESREPAIVDGPDPGAVAG